MSFLFSGGLAESERLAVLLSDVAPSVCSFWSSGRFAWEERAGCFAF